MNGIGRRNKAGEYTFIDRWAELVTKHAKNVALLFEAQEWTYADLDEQSNQYGELFLELGIQQGQVVALCLCNTPEFLLCLVGLFKIGATVALLNTNVCGSSFIHCLDVCKAKKVIYHKETLHVIKSIEQARRDGLELFYCGTMTLGHGTRLEPHVKSTAPISPIFRNQIKLTDTAVHIFTSGTTGLPKAAKINHMR